MSSIPEYLNTALFKEALEQTLRENITVKNMEIVRSTVGGNYSSDIYRVSLQYRNAEGTNQDEQIEIKLLVKDLLQVLTDNSREHFMYETILPEMNATLQRCGFSKALSPRVFLTRKTDKELHIFEDLNARGYKVCDRLLGFTFAEAQMVLTKLGQFHAASMVYKLEHADIVAGMKEFFGKSDPNLMSFIQTQIDGNTEYVVKIVEKWPNFAEIAEKMRKNTGENFMRKFLAILNKEDAEVRVIAHGDLWLNNILMLENEHDVEDAVFLDYQNCFEGSAALDINNLFLTSLQMKVLQSKRSELIEHYYKSLSETLKACKFPTANIPTLQSLLNEIKRTEYFTYYVLIFVFPQINLSKELTDGMNFEGFFDNERLLRNRQNMFSNPRVVATYKHILLRLNDLGVLD